MGMKAKRSVDLAAGRDIIGQAAFCMTRQRGQGSQRTSIERQGEVVIVSSLGRKTAGNA